MEGGERYRGAFLCQRYERHGMRACGGLTNDETNHVYQRGMVEVGFRCKDGDLTNNMTFVRPVRLVSTVHTACPLLKLNEEATQDMRSTTCKSCPAKISSILLFFLAFRRAHCLRLAEDMNCAGVKDFPSGFAT